MEYMSTAFRWIHIIAGITWIGLLYYFNWMNGHIMAAIGDAKKTVVPELMPRVLYWFRWGAAYTWVTGVFLLFLVFYHGGLMFEGDNTWNIWSYLGVAIVFLGFFIYDIIFKIIKAKQPVGVIVAFILSCAVIYYFVHCAQFGYRAYVIHLGAMYGTFMALNVWMRIWPAQKKIIAAVKNGEAPDANLVAMAGLRSKHNTYMSVPLVWTMVNAHTTTVGAASPYWLVGSIAVGWIVVWLLYKKSATIKGF